MQAKLSTRKKIAKTIQWIGVAGFFSCFVGFFVMDDLYLREPRIPQQSTGNVVPWNWKGDIHYITRNEDNWRQFNWAVAFSMFCLIALSVYLTVGKSEK
jgi:hypothetical protein